MRCHSSNMALPCLMEGCGFESSHPQWEREFQNKIQWHTIRDLFCHNFSTRCMEVMLFVEARSHHEDQLESCGNDPFLSKSPSSLCRSFFPLIGTPFSYYRDFPLLSSGDAFLPFLYLFFSLWCKPVIFSLKKQKEKKKRKLTTTLQSSLFVCVTCHRIATKISKFNPN